MSRSTLVCLLAILTVACSQSARERWARHAHDWELVDHPADIGPQPVAVVPTRTVAFGAGAWLCVPIPRGYMLGNVPLTVVRRPGGDTLAVTAQLQLADGEAVPFRFVGVQAWRAPDGSHGQNYCLAPATALGTNHGTDDRTRRIRAIVLTSNAPVRIERVYWEPPGR